MRHTGLSRTGCIVAILATVAAAATVAATVTEHSTCVAPQMDTGAEVATDIPDSTSEGYPGVTSAPARSDIFNQFLNSPKDKRHLHELRVRKCAAIVKAFYPNSGFGEHVEYFISAHEKYGIIDEWQWSLAYGGANFSLRCGVRAKNGCAGPMDRPGGSTNAHKNINAHCRETATFHKRGLTGYRLMQKVFYPAAPRDWGGQRIFKTYTKHAAYIEKAYQEGWL